MIPNASPTPLPVTLASATPFRAHWPPCYSLNLPTRLLPQGLCMCCSLCSEPLPQIFVCHSLFPSGLCSVVTILFKVGLHTRVCVRARARTHTHTHTHYPVLPVPSLLCFSFLHGAYHSCHFSVSLPILECKLHEGKDFCVFFTAKD